MNLLEYRLLPFNVDFAPNGGAEQLVAPVARMVALRLAIHEGPLHNRMLKLWAAATAGINSP
jgi:hypothetical protein